MNDSILCCPYCKNNLIFSANTARCNYCSKQYHNTEGFFSFIDDRLLQSYDVLPDDWDTYAWELVEKQRGRERMKKVIRYIPKEGIYLDVGTGRGDGTFEVSKVKQTVGIDYGLRSLRVCHKNCLTVFQADARHLPFKDNTFDSITMLDVIEHIPSPERALSEIHRVLKKTGTFLLQTPTIETMKEKVKAIDFYKKYKSVRFINFLFRCFRTPQAVFRSKRNLGIQPYDIELSESELEKLIYISNFIINKKTKVRYYVPEITIQFFAFSDLYILKAR